MAGDSRFNLQMERDIESAITRRAEQRKLLPYSIVQGSNEYVMAWRRRFDEEAEQRDEIRMAANKQRAVTQFLRHDCSTHGHLNTTRRHYLFWTKTLCARCGLDAAQQKPLK